jgi:hypothetical protein
MSARCKGCDAEIVWATHETSGKAIPLDAKPDEAKGSLALVKGEVHRFNDLDQRLGRDRYVPHHQTCPNADDFRRR